MAYNGENAVMTKGGREMLRAKALWKSEKGRAVAVKVAHMVLTMVLSAGKLGGLYGPWALGAVALSGGRSRGFFSVLVIRA